MAPLSSLVIARFKRLPRRSGEVWQGGVVRARTWVQEPDGSVRRPWAAVWISTAMHLMNVRLAEAAAEADAAPDASLALQVLVDLGLKFAHCRPTRLEVADDALGAQLVTALDDPEISVSVRADLPDVDRIVRDMEAADRDAPPPPDALDAPGVTVERMRAFAAAARDFYVAAPWQHLSDADLIHVEAPVASGFKYLSVLGAAGQTFGLGFFTNPQQFDAVQEGADPETVLRDHGKWAVLYGPVEDMPFGDGDLWEQHHLPVAGPSAYPVAFWFGPDHELRRPRAKELADLEAILRVFSRSTEAEIDSGRWSHDVPSHDGPRTVKLAIPALLVPIDDRLSTAATPLDQAEELIYRTFDARGRRRLQLARRALELSADCADAYVVLAQASHSLEDACALYEKGVAAGERALGPDVFAQQAGHFWGMVGTRPYMRARFGLARCLEELDRREEAIGHYRELLRLDPGDNQGVRYSLLASLLLVGRDDEAAVLIEQFGDEPTALWRYGRALSVFRREGDSRAARECLRVALRANRHVPAQLLADDDEPPDPPPASYTPGSREEAVICDSELGEAWWATPEAISWLRAQAPTRKSAQRRKR